MSLFLIGLFVGGLVFLPGGNAGLSQTEALLLNETVPLGETSVYFDETKKPEENTMLILFAACRDDGPTETPAMSKPRVWIVLSFVLVFAAGIVAGVFGHNWFAAKKPGRRGGVRPAADHGELGQGDRAERRASRPGCARSSRPTTSGCGPTPG